jgi:hypothetical protein
MCKFDVYLRYVVYRRLVYSLHRCVYYALMQRSYCAEH